MVKSKILYIFVILALTVALCATSAGATSYPIYSTNFDLYGRGLYKGTMMSPGNTGGIHAQWVKAADSSNPPLFSFGVQSVSTENSTSDFIDIMPDYTYTVDLSFVVDVYALTQPSDQSQFVTDMVNLYVPYLGNMIQDKAVCPMLINTATIVPFNDVSDYSSTAGHFSTSLVSSSADGYGVRISVTFQIVFRTPSSMNEHSYNALGFSHKLSNPDPDNSSLYRFAFNFRVQSLTYSGVYDDTGAIYDDTVDRIVSGQKEAIIEGQERERAEVESEANSSSDEANAAAESAFSGSTSIIANLRTLYNTIGYEGTDFNFTFPAAHNVPYVGNLWDEQSIPFQYYIDILPQPVRSALVIIIFVGGIAWAIHIFKSLLSIINGGKD